MYVNLDIKRTYTYIYTLYIHNHLHLSLFFTYIYCASFAKAKVQAPGVSAARPARPALRAVHHAPQ